jgi:hypothetical protein
LGVRDEKQIILAQYDYENANLSRVESKIYLKLPSDIRLSTNLDEKGEELYAELENSITQDSIPVYLIAEETTTVGDYSLIQEFVSNTLLLYNIVPTISYRKNSIGINTKDMDSHEHSILYIA